MSNRTCLYDVLNSNGKINVTQDSAPADLKKAFRVLAMKYHPDRVQNASEAEKTEAASRFAEIQYAYNILSDDVTRQMYDAGGFAAIDEAEENGGGSHFDFAEMDIDAVLKDLDKIKVSEDTIAVRRKGAKPSVTNKFLKRKKPEDAAEAASPETEAKPESKTAKAETKPAGKVMMDTALRDEFADFARKQGNTALAEKLEALEVVYPKPADRGPSR